MTCCIILSLKYSLKCCTSLNLDLKTLEKRNRKGIRKSREKEKGKAPVAESLPHAPLSSLSVQWACPVSSAPSALAVDRRVRTRARRRISRPRRPPTRPAPFLEPRQCPAHTPHLISCSFALCPRRQLPSGTRTGVPGHPARRRPPQASPSSAPR